MTQNTCFANFSQKKVNSLNAKTDSLQQTALFYITSLKGIFWEIVCVKNRRGLLRPVLDTNLNQNR